MRSGNWSTFSLCMMPKRKKTKYWPQDLSWCCSLCLVASLPASLVGQHTGEDERALLGCGGCKEKVLVPAGLLALPLQAVAAWAYHPATPPGRPCPPNTGDHGFGPSAPLGFSPLHGAWLLQPPLPCPLTPHQVMRPLHKGCWQWVLV